MVRKVRIKLNPKIDYITRKYLEQYLTSYDHLVKTNKPPEDNSIIALQSEALDKFLRTDKSVSKHVLEIMPYDDNENSEY